MVEANKKQANDSCLLQPLLRSLFPPECFVDNGVILVPQLQQPLNKRHWVLGALLLPNNEIPRHRWRAEGAREVVPIRRYTLSLDIVELSLIH